MSLVRDTPLTAFSHILSFPPSVSVVPDDGSSAISSVARRCLSTPNGHWLASNYNQTSRVRRNKGERIRVAHQDGAESQLRPAPNVMLREVVKGIAYASFSNFSASALLRILKTLLPAADMPCRAFLPFFIVTMTGFSISTCAFSLTEYAVQGIGFTSNIDVS